MECVPAWLTLRTSTPTGERWGCCGTTHTWAGPERERETESAGFWLAIIPTPYLLHGLASRASALTYHLHRRHHRLLSRRPEDLQYACVTILNMSPDSPSRQVRGTMEGGRLQPLTSQRPCPARRQWASRPAPPSHRRVPACSAGAVPHSPDLQVLHHLHLLPRRCCTTLSLTCTSHQPAPAAPAAQMLPPPPHPAAAA